LADTAQKDGNEEIVFQGKIVEVVRQPMRIGKKSVVFESARRSPGTRLIIVDLKNKKLIITKEYRTEIDQYDYRLPGGKVFDSLSEYNQFLKSGSDILKPAVERATIEAREETGVIAKKVEHIHTSVNGATVIWDLFYFVIDEWVQDEQKLEAGEDISVEWLSFEAANEIALSGKMQEDRSVAVLLRWLNQQDNI
jgi:ADP-ribose pyrophosphatase